MGGSPDFLTGQTPDQQTAAGQGGPAYERAAGLAAEGMPLYDVGAIPLAPSYNVVNPNMMMPSQQWWNSMSPEVKAGLWAPYKEGAQGLMEQMGVGGQYGSPRGGVSGAGATAMGKFAADASNKVGLQAWQMTAPAMQKYWDTLQAREMWQPMQDYNMSKQAWMQDIMAKQAAQNAVLGIYGETINNASTAWAPSSEERFMRGIFGGIGGYLGGGGWGGAISGFGSGYYGGSGGE